MAILGTTGDVAHDVLASSIEVLDFVPIAGLAPAAKALLSIWDALQLVGVRFMCMFVGTLLTVYLYRRTAPRACG